jgi:hypothetical protein
MHCFGVPRLPLLRTAIDVALGRQRNPTQAGGNGY